MSVVQKIAELAQNGAISKGVRKYLEGVAPDLERLATKATNLGGRLTDDEQGRLQTFYNDYLRTAISDRRSAKGSGAIDQVKLNAEIRDDFFNKVLGGIGKNGNERLALRATFLRENLKAENGLVKLGNDQTITKEQYDSIKLSSAAGLQLSPQDSELLELARSAERKTALDRARQQRSADVAAIADKPTSPTVAKKGQEPPRIIATRYEKPTAAEKARAVDAISDMSFFEVFRAGSKTFPKLIDDMGAKVTALKSAGKEVSVDNFVDALRRDQHLKDGLTASYVDFMSKAAEKGLNGRLARAEFIRGIVQSLPEPLTSDPEKLKAVYKNTAQFLDETGKAFLDTKKARAVDAISETLSNLMVGKFNRDQLDARLKALETAARNHDLIDANLVREPAKGLELAKGMVPGMKAKEAEKRLLAGEKITPDEMLSLIKAKHADFDKWEKITTEKAIKDKLRAEGRYSPERAAASSLVSSALKWPLAAAGTLAAALGIGIAADRFFLGGEGKVQAVDSVKNTISGFRTSTEAGLERRKQEEFAQRVRTCNAQMGEVGEVSGNCIIARFSEEFSTLSNVFNAEGLTEAERLYAKKIGEALPTAYRDAEGSAQKFNTIANSIRVNAVEEMKNDITMKGHLPVDPTTNQVSFKNVDRMIQADIAKNPFLAAKLQ